jgi:hypothetical protein
MLNVIYDSSIWAIVRSLHKLVLVKKNFGYVVFNIVTPCMFMAIGTWFLGKEALYFLHEMLAFRFHVKSHALTCKFFHQFVH